MTCKIKPLLVVLTAACTIDALAAVKPVPLVVTSAFKNGETLPKEFTADGANISPPLSWKGVPKSARSIAIVCSDPDAPRETFYHWLLYNLPATTSGLLPNQLKKPGLGAGVLQGTNDFMRAGYRGPAPPPGKVHHYHFKVMALDMILPLPPGAQKTEFNKAIDGHVVASGELVVTYSR